MKVGSYEARLELNYNIITIFFLLDLNLNTLKKLYSSYKKQIFNVSLVVHYLMVILFNFSKLMKPPRVLTKASKNISDISPPTIIVCPKDQFSR